MRHRYDERWLGVVSGGRVDLAMVEHEMLPHLDPAMLDHYIAELRESETETRALWKRLASLRDESTRKCPVCGGPVTGRSDRVYCRAACRVKAHRAQRD